MRRLGAGRQAAPSAKGKTLRPIPRATDPVWLKTVAFKRQLGTLAAVGLFREVGKAKHGLSELTPIGAKRPAQPIAHACWSNSICGGGSKNAADQFTSRVDQWGGIGDEGMRVPSGRSAMASMPRIG